MSLDKGPLFACIDNLGVERILELNKVYSLGDTGSGQDLASDLVPVWESGTGLYVGKFSYMLFSKGFLKPWEIHRCDSCDSTMVVKGTCKSCRLEKVAENN